MRETHKNSEGAKTHGGVSSEGRKERKMGQTAEPRRDEANGWTNRADVALEKGRRRWTGVSDGAESGGTLLQLPSGRRSHPGRPLWLGRRRRDDRLRRPQWLELLVPPGRGCTAGREAGTERRGSLALGGGTRTPGSRRGRQQRRSSRLLWQRRRDSHGIERRRLDSNGFDAGRGWHRPARLCRCSNGGRDRPCLRLQLRQSGNQIRNRHVRSHRCSMLLHPLSTRYRDRCRCCGVHRVRRAAVQLRNVTSGSGHGGRRRGGGARGDDHQRRACDDRVDSHRCVLQSVREESRAQRPL